MAIFENRQCENLSDQISIFEDSGVSVLDFVIISLFFFRSIFNDRINQE